MKLMTCTKTNHIYDDICSQRNIYTTKLQKILSKGNQEMVILSVKYEK